MNPKLKTVSNENANLGRSIKGRRRITWFVIQKVFAFSKKFNLEFVIYAIFFVASITTFDETIAKSILRKAFA